MLVLVCIGTRVTPDCIEMVVSDTCAPHAEMLRVVFKVKTLSAFCSLRGMMEEGGS